MIKILAKLSGLSISSIRREFITGIFDPAVALAQPEHPSSVHPSTVDHNSTTIQQGHVTARENSSMGISADGITKVVLLEDDSTERLQAEYDVFQMMLSLLDKDVSLGLSGLWQAGVPKMKLKVYQLDRVLKWTLPRMHSHFKEIHLTPEILVAQWFITLFSYTVPLPLTLRLWDYIFLTGWAGMYRVALALLKCLESNLENEDLEAVRY